MRIDGADPGLDAGVEGGETVVQSVAGLVDGIVACDPGIGFVVCGDLFPEPDSAVLKVFVVPEGGIVGATVAVPIGVLTTRKGMEIENGVDFVFSTLGMLVWDFEGQERHTRSITRSRCLNPDSFSTRGFISSSKWR
jgi:hypothetical protein